MAKIPLETSTTRINKMYFFIFKQFCNAKLLKKIGLSNFFEDNQPKKMYFVSFSLQKYLHAVAGIDANLQAHPQEPPEVYSNVLPPSVGETTGGIHPMPSGINISAPPEVNVTYSWAE
jgi:hypothetical protein